MMCTFGKKTLVILGRREIEGDICYFHVNQNFMLSDFVPTGSVTILINNVRMLINVINYSCVIDVTE